MMKLKQGWIGGKEIQGSELIATDYSIELNGKNQDDCLADIEILIETNNDKSVYKISGLFDEVFDAAIDFLAKNDVLQKKSFIFEIDQAKFNFNKKINVSEETSPKEVGFNLRKLLAEKNYNVKDFAKAANKNSGNVYRELKGTRPISIEQAINYSKTLNCDPVKILFKDLRTKVWGNVDTCNHSETYRYVDACEIFVRLKEEQKSVLVPRDIYQENIECFKIVSLASSLNNHYVFYYKSYEKKFVYNKQVVLGIEVKDDFVGDEIRYYFGILENHRGQINLINPDPFKKGAIVLENINQNKIIFVSTIVAILNNESLKRSNTENKLIQVNNLSELQTEMIKVINLAQSLIVKINKEDPSNTKHIEKAKKLYRNALETYNELNKKILKINSSSINPVSDKTINDLIKTSELQNLENNILEAYQKSNKLAS